VCEDVLPASAAPVPVPPPGGARASPPIPRFSLRVLVIEDGEDAGQSLAVLLRLYGCEVDVAVDCPSALAAARANLPDALLIDIGLPGRDGYDVAKQLRGLFEGRPLLVALTGHGQPSDHRRSADEGFDHHLVKPVAPADLVRILREYALGRGR
jgi:CheY-like chemotaxis protein